MLFTFLNWGIMHYRWQFKWEEDWVLQSYWCPRSLDHHHIYNQYLHYYEKVNPDIETQKKVNFNICLCGSIFLMIINVCDILILIYSNHFKKKPQQPINRPWSIKTYCWHRRCLPRRSCLWRIHVCRVLGRKCK